MRKLNYYGIALLPLMLASCGGNFGVQPVVESTPTAYPGTFKSKDVPTSPPPCRAFGRNHAGQPARRRCGNAVVEAEYCFSS